MSGDEVFVLVVSAAVAFFAWMVYFVRAVRYDRVPTRLRLLVLLAPFAAGATIISALKTLAAHDVRDAPIYLLLYSVLGAAWVAVGMMLVPLLGVSVRDDALERANPAAALATAGATYALTLCYIGGNIGDGPGWWVVVFASGLATLALMLMWLLLEMTSGVSEAITVDRDRASGLRLAGFLVACGAIFGRGSAGTWVSAELTVVDFAWIALPAVPLLVLAIVAERSLRPSPANPRPSLLMSGAVPAVLYVGAAAALVSRLGMPE